MGITFTFRPPHFEQTKRRCCGTSTKIMSFQSLSSSKVAGTIAHFLAILPVCRSAPIFLVVRLFFPKPDGTGMLEETMQEFLAQVAGSLAMKLPPPGLWSRFVRWAVWGKHAQSFSFPPASVAIEQAEALRQLRAPSMHTI
jgi:hypothetical protein